MNYKNATRRIYDQNASAYEEKTKDYSRNYILEDAELFVDSLSGSNVLDIGCGPGRDIEFLQSKGLNVYGIDISSSMCGICRNKGLKVVMGDLEDLPFGENYFDGIWAYTSLLHIPKSNFGRILDNIGELLKNEGVLYLGMKEGDFEGWKEGKNIDGEKRFYSLYKDNEMRNILSLNFKILKSSNIKLGEDNYLNYFCRKLS